MERSFFSCEYFDSHGGDRTRRPYWQCSGPDNWLYQKRLVFVSQTWYADFESWIQQACLALDASLFEWSEGQKGFVRSGTLSQMSKTPEFIVDFSSGSTCSLFGSPELWINALAVRTKADFDRICQEGREAIKVGKYPRPAERCRSYSEDPSLFLANGTTSGLF